MTLKLSNSNVFITNEILHVLHILLSLRSGKERRKPTVLPECTEWICQPESTYHRIFSSDWRLFKQNSHNDPGVDMAAYEH